MAQKTLTRIKTHHIYVPYMYPTHSIHLYCTVQPALTNFIRSYEYVDGIKNRQNNNGIRMNGKNERHNLLTAEKNVNNKKKMYKNSKPLQT